MRPYWEIIGQAIREARNSVEESQRTTAQRLDLRPFSSYCEMEDGKIDPNVALRALMQKLHEREGAHEEAQRRALRERDEARARVEIITPHENNPVAEFFSSPNTPETDALDCELHNPKVLCDRYSAMRDHACRLEAERDEAREEIRRLRKLLADANRGAEINAHINNSLTKKLQERTAEREAVIEAAKAVVERWDQPSWKDTEPTAGVIYRLRDVVERITGEVET